MNRSTRLSVAVLSLLTCCLGYSAQPVFDPAEYIRHIKHLASDEMQGRGNGTPELEQAAEYIADQFKSAGLQPAGENGSFFQPFTLTVGSELGPGNRLSVSGNKDAWQARVGRDFIPVGFGPKTEVSGDVVFAGYGITAEEYGYDDYKGLDVANKIVLVLAHEPGEQDPKSPFNGKEPTLHGEDTSKAVHAKYRDAAAILIVQDPGNHGAGEPDLPPAALAGHVDELGICAIRISRAAAERILEPSGKRLLDLQREIDGKMRPAGFTLSHVRAQIEMDVKKVRKQARNVLGILPGSDPSAAEETLVLGAHYDHLGHGGRGSMLPELIGQIHNGADDNASGTAGLIELARALAGQDRRRAYLFIAFAGEELGLHGSVYWTAHPTRPVQKVLAMLNLDMIGRSRDEQVQVSGVGTSPVFADLTRAAAERLALKMKTSQGGYGSSDHTSFYAKDVPVLFFFSGLHSDYHRPSDDWDKINAQGAVKILALVYDVATHLNALERRPQFTRVQEPMPAGHQSGQEQSGYGAYFGSVPDMSDDVKGVRFTDVRPNSPAAKAGLKAQDILVKFAGKDISNLQDFTYMLRTHKPGQTVEVTVLRDGKHLTVPVQLEVRR
jgi:hypothetical protein